MIDVIVYTSMISVLTGYLIFKKVYKRLNAKGTIFKKRFKITKKNINKYDLNSEICVICLDNYHVKCDNHQECNKKCYQLYCNHIFHKKCIMEWLYNNMKCPLCNLSIMTKFNKSFDQLQSEILQEKNRRREQRREQREQRRFLRPRNFLLN